MPRPWKAWNGDAVPLFPPTLGRSQRTGSSHIATVPMMVMYLCKDKRQKDVSTVRDFL
jgi:hypothetical protein